jgi:DNA-binding GntR family transcriptional regulator
MGTINSNIIEQKPLYLQVAERLRELIYRRELSPGDWIDEIALTQQLAISRTPLREALKVLQQEGLVELIPRRGCRVKELDEQELLEMFPVMATLEGLCTNLAAQKLSATDMKQLEKLHERLEKYAASGNVDKYYEVNREFHTAIQTLSGNRWLSRIASELRNVLVLARHRQLTLPGRLLESLEEHRTIMQALKDNNPDAAQQAMLEHICQQEKVLRQELESSTSVAIKANA